MNASNYNPLVALALVPAALDVHALPAANEARGPLRDRILAALDRLDGLERKIDRLLAASPARLLSQREAATTMGIRRATVRDLVRAGRLRIVRVGGKTWIPYAEIARFAASADAPRERGKPGPARREGKRRITPAEDAATLRALDLDKLGEAAA